MKLNRICATIAFASGLSGLAGAANIALTDPSFESGSLGGTSGVTVSGWFAFGTAASGQNVTGSGFWSAMTPLVGNSAAYAIQNSATNGVPIYQTVELDAGVTYRLTAAFGTNSAAPKNNALYALQIWNLGFSAMQAGTSGTLTAGNNVFVDDFVDFTPSVSGKYQVGVRNNGYVPGTGANNNESTVFFDNVRLTVIPEPSSAALLGLCGIAFTLRRRR